MSISEALLICSWTKVACTREIAGDPGVALTSADDITNGSLTLRLCTLAHPRVVIEVALPVNLQLHYCCVY